VNSVEDRVQAAMSAAAHLSAQEIAAAPPLRLPSAAPAGARQRHPPRRWTRWAVPLTAAAAVVALAVSLVLIKGVHNGGAVPPTPTTSAIPAPPTGPGGAPRYYVASANSAAGESIVAGDSVTGRLLAKVALPAPGNTTTFAVGITAAADDRTFVVMTLTYPTASLNQRDVFKNATGTARWYAVQLDPGTAHPARLTSLPIKPETAHGDGAYYAQATALSRSGRDLAVIRSTASGGLAVQVFSVATGQSLHHWTTNDPSLSVAKSATQGLAGQPSLSWIDGDRLLAVETASRAPKSDDLGYLAETDTVRELSVAGPSSGALLADSRVVWGVRTGSSPQTLLQACAAEQLGRGPTGHFISADGTTLGCTAVTGPGTDPNLSFVTYPLGAGTATAAKGNTQYEVTQMAKKAISTYQALWVSPSGDAIIGAWTIYAPGTLEDDPNGLHVGVLSHGKFTPLRFPPGFDQEASVASITW
jgi:hypothetical protein